MSKVLAFTDSDVYWSFSDFYWRLPAQSDRYWLLAFTDFYWYLLITDTSVFYLLTFTDPDPYISPNQQMTYYKESLSPSKPRRSSSIILVLPFNVNHHRVTWPPISSFSTIQSTRSRRMNQFYLQQSGFSMEFEWGIAVMLSMDMNQKEWTAR